MRKKKKKKIRSRVILLVILIILIELLVKKMTKGSIITNDIFKGSIITEEVPVIKTNKYFDNIDYNSFRVDESINTLLTDYFDLYYETLKTLNVQDNEQLFSNNEAYYIDYSANKVLVNSRKSALNDMTLFDCSYDLKYIKYEINDDIEITVYETGYLNFNFMKDITSKMYNIENNFVITKVNGNYKIKSIDKVQDYYVMITNEYTSSTNYVSKLDNLVEKYTNLFDEAKDKNISLYNDYNNKKNKPTKICSHYINRTDSYNYAVKYAKNANTEWYYYGDSGGNCQNYGSQVIYAGGIPMDIKGDYQWKHYDTNLNTKNEKKGRSNSWTSVNYFYEYAKNSTTSGLCSIVDANIYYAEPGDIIQVGYDGYSHTVVPIKIYNSDYDEIIINSNTNDLENYPLSGYVYQNKRLIKVLGYNE